MEGITDYVGKHRFLVAGGAIGLALIGYWSFSKSSSSGGSVYYNTGSDPNLVQASTQLQLAQMQQQSQASAINAQQSANAQNIAGSIQLATIQGQNQLDITKIAADTQTQLATIGGQNQLSLSQLAASMQTSLADITAKSQDYQSSLSAQVSLSQISASQDVANKTLQTQLAATLAGLDLQSHNSDLMYKANYDALLAGYYANQNATQVTLAQNSSNQQIALAQIAQQGQTNAAYLDYMKTDSANQSADYQTYLNSYAQLASQQAWQQGALIISGHNGM